MCARRLLALLSGAAALAAVTPARASAAPAVDAMVVFRSGAVVGPKRVAVRRVRVNRCALGAGLPVGVLPALRLGFAARGSCRSLYVHRVGRDRASGVQGWVYKVGRSLPGRAASDPSAVLRPGQRVIWFWCRRAGACQRTLTIQAPRTARRGARYSVVVRGYDDFGRGRRVRGATVRYDGRSARTNRRGVAVLRARRSGRVRLVATRRGMIRSFPSTVAVR